MRCPFATPTPLRQNDRRKFLYGLCQLIVDDEVIIKFILRDFCFCVAQPQSQAGVLGSNVTFSVSVSGTAPFSYVWHYNGTTLPGATNATLVLPSLQTNQVGTYGVFVFNSAGAVASADATLVILIPVAFNLQPVGQIVLPGTNVTLSSLAMGTGVVRYQWRFEGSNILAATNASYSFINAAYPTHHGNFSVVVTDDLSSLTS